MKKEEIQMLETEGLQARVRNKLSAIKTLFCLVEMYHGNDDPVRLLSMLDIIDRTHISAIDSLGVARDLATHTGNWVLQKKLKELDLYFVQCKEFLTEKRESLRKHKSFLFNTKAREHDEIIEEIIKTVE